MSTGLAMAGRATCVPSLGMVTMRFATWGAGSAVTLPMRKGNNALYGQRETRSQYHVSMQVTVVVSSNRRCRCWFGLPKLGEILIHSPKQNIPGRRVEAIFLKDDKGCFGVNDKVGVHDIRFDGQPKTNIDSPREPPSNGKHWFFGG
jgi:hypothetical protein